MLRYEFTIGINAPIEQVFDFHNNTNNLILITPPNIQVRIEEMGTPGLGYWVRLRIRQFAIITTEWTVRVTRYERPFIMVDEQIQGPFKSWKHNRRFSVTNSGTLLHECIEYEMPLGGLGKLVNRLFVEKQIRTMFEFRQQRTKQILETSYQ